VVGEAVKPIGGVTVNEYVPFGSLNMMVVVVEVCRVPSNVTDQRVPEGKPLSVKVTVYVTRLNVTDSLTDAPFTSNEPPATVGSYALSVVAAV
jgi:hypothetical protein